MMRLIVLVILFTLLFVSCRHSPDSSSQERVNTNNNYSRDSYSGDKSLYEEYKTKDSNKESSKSLATIDGYDDGLLDGEAAAEGYRLAGKPGMQLGEEDDEEDYEDGYDDGYDE